MKVDLCTAFGWTLEQAGDISLLEYKQIVKYWEKVPPLHKSILVYMGYEFKDKDEVKAKKNPTLQDVLGLFEELNKN